MTAANNGIAANGNYQINENMIMAPGVAAAYVGNRNHNPLNSNSFPSVPIAKV